jgi:hypothetical protein
LIPLGNLQGHIATDLQELDSYFIERVSNFISSVLICKALREVTDVRAETSVYYTSQ